jgi:hypothetical protein
MYQSTASMATVSPKAGREGIFTHSSRHQEPAFTFFGVNLAQFSGKLRFPLLAISAINNRSTSHPARPR